MRAVFAQLRRERLATQICDKKNDYGPQVMGPRPYNAYNGLVQVTRPLDPYFFLYFAIYLRGHRSIRVCDPLNKYQDIKKILKTKATSWCTRCQRYSPKVIKEMMAIGRDILESRGLRLTYPFRSTIPQVHLSRPLPR